ncbi:MAG: Rpn family recombination-promoting nuclease/putative transposase [Synergistaceae bacterium]|jgi:predicted transposase/invertase (TIGR01784 family)|nr:Rpn family recombination-promoting nuclease/putative transposase [Synergistaceae bacterium]
MAGIIFLPLKSDIVFKLVFGDPRYIEILRAFLLVALDIPPEEYEGMKIIDPHLERDRLNDKLGILDVRVLLRDGTIISVEMQARETPFMAERVAFSTGRNLSRQIAPGQSYAQIRKVVTIVIADYKLISANNFYHHTFRLYDLDKSVLFTTVMEVQTFELKKLPKGPVKDSRQRELVNWLKLIRSEKKEEIAMLATQTAEMDFAVRRLKQLSADEQVRMLYEARELALMDEMVRNEAARAKGEAEGRAKVAQNMLSSGMEVEMISKYTGLTPDEIMALRD